MEDYIGPLLLVFVVTGAVCILVLTPWWLLDRARLSAFRRLALVFIAMGALLPVAIIPVWFWINSHGSFQAMGRIQDVAKVVWPSSILLLALDTAGPPPRLYTVAVYSAAILGNVGMYGVVGLGVSWVYGRFKHRVLHS